MVNIFTRGSCLNFFILLKQIFPEAEAYFNQQHIITRVGSSFYDITGRVSGKGFRPFTSFYNKEGLLRAWKQMLKAEHNIEGQK